MTKLIRAPWTPEQVAALNAFQRRSGVHPFTCGGEHTPGSPRLIAREDGWHCSDPYQEGCDYRQDWAHAFMTDQTPQEPAGAPQSTPGDSRAAEGATEPGDGRTAGRDELREQYEARAFNAVAPALEAHDRWLPLSVRRAVADAVLAVRDREVEQLRAAIARVRRLCDLTISTSVRAQAIAQARDTLAALDGHQQDTRTTS